MILPLADMEPIGPFAEPRPSMRGRYLIRDAKKAVAMALIDAGLSLLPRRAGPMPTSPKRILLADWGHLGDVLTTMGAIRALRERYPAATIGMIVGSWGRPAIAATGLVDELHIVDHWRINRSVLSIEEKHKRHRETQAAALTEIRLAGYDLAIDFYPFFPAAHPLFWQAGVRARIGYTSAGFGSLLTHPVRWPDEPAPFADQYRVLLDRVDPLHPFAPGTLRPVRARDTLVPLPEDLRKGTEDQRYVVFHPGAGAAYKDWGVEKWRALLKRLSASHPQLRLVLTGAGAGEMAIAGDLATSASGILSLAGKVNWEEFISVIAGADLVICPDTATGHAAALFNVPIVSIFTGTNSAAQWAPYGKRVEVLLRPMVCAPCNRAGCAAMACVREVEVEAVWQAAVRQLTRSLTYTDPHG